MISTATVHKMSLRADVGPPSARRFIQNLAQYLIGLWRATHMFDRTLVHKSSTSGRVLWAGSRPVKGSIYQCTMQKL